MLRTRFPRPLGDVGNPDTWSVPTLFRVVPAAKVENVVRSGELDKSIIRDFCEAAQSLEADGATAIAGCCGFLAAIQSDLQASVRVPVISSSLIMVPWLRAVYGPNCRIGILTVDARKLSAIHFGGSPDDHAEIEGIEGGSELHRVITQDLTALAFDRAEADVVAAAGRLVDRCPDVAAIVMECTNFPPYREAVARRTGKPIFDMLSLISWVVTAHCPDLQNVWSIQEPTDRIVANN